MNVKMDDCFQFGLGAFETISVVDGRPIFLDRPGRCCKIPGSWHASRTGHRQDSCAGISEKVDE